MFIKLVKLYLRFPSGWQAGAKGSLCTGVKQAAAGGYQWPQSVHHPLSVAGIHT
jgi:hypothetical protein